MSIRLLSKVWDSGAYAEGTLLVLLALADWANDDGGSVFPFVEQVAAKARLSTRQAQRALKTLREDGVLEPIKNTSGGRGRRVEYQINLERMTKWHPSPKGDTEDAKGCHLEQERVTPETERVTSATSHIDEPSLEPSREPLREPPGPQPVSESDLLGPVPEKPKPKPKLALVVGAETIKAAQELYNEYATHSGWPKCQLLTDMRKGHLRKRLEEAGGIEGWRAALDKATASDFCSGRAPPGRDRTSPFMVDIDFLITQSSFVKLMEGKYDNRVSTHKAQGSDGIIAVAARAAAKKLAAGAN